MASSSPVPTRCRSTASSSAAGLMASLSLRWERMRTAVVRPGTTIGSLRGRTIGRPSARWSAVAALRSLGGAGVRRGRRRQQRRGALPRDAEQPRDPLVAEAFRPELMGFGAAYLRRGVGHPVEQLRHLGDDEWARLAAHELRQHDAGRDGLTGRAGALDKLVDLAPGLRQRFHEGVECRSGALRLCAHGVAPLTGTAAPEGLGRNNYCDRLPGTLLSSSGCGSRTPRPGRCGGTTPPGLLRLARGIRALRPGAPRAWSPGPGSGS